MAEDYYKILEVGREASAEEIKKSYRRLAMKCHPDRNQGDAECEEKFKKLSEAYACLSDPKKRENYDRFGTAEGMGAGFDPFGGASGFGDIFGDVFGDVFGEFFGGGGSRRGARPARGNDLRYDLGVSLEEAAFGTEKTIEITRWESCGSCSGTGSKSEKPTTCPDCRGMGQVRYQQGFFSISKTCPRCKGVGTYITDPCPECRGQGKRKVPRQVSVMVPAGVDTGSRLKMTNEGEPGTRGAPPGDLYIVLEVEPHPFFHRDGQDLYCEVPITFSQAVLGTDIEVPSLDGSARLKVPAGTQPGARFRLKGKGVTRIGGRSRGDQVIMVNVVVPKKINQRQRDIIEEFESLSEEDSSGSLKDRLKNIFAGRA